MGQKASRLGGLFSSVTLRQEGFEVSSLQKIGMVGSKDNDILEYSEKHNMTLISGDKDFGCLIEFGTLWGRGKVILLRYRLINIYRILEDIIKVINGERENLDSKKSVVIVLSEGRYRIHLPSS